MACFRMLHLWQGPKIWCSIVVSISARHAEDLGSIPGGGGHYACWRAPPPVARWSRLWSTKQGVAGSNPAGFMPASFSHVSHKLRHGKLAGTALEHDVMMWICWSSARKEAKLRTPGVEPGSQAWEACMMPLNYVRHDAARNCWCIYTEQGGLGGSFFWCCLRLKVS